ncbi:MAG: right-handed parallel beta-helix repeat-containing protein [Candidatus Doudnabacteria bacterium]|nr:right-handed parallel beta-helix repeat-containing protein [Candidatus Doudnabacteria bacterium]
MTFLKPKLVAPIFLSLFICLIPSVSYALSYQELITAQTGKVLADSTAANYPVGTFDDVNNSLCQISGWAKDPNTTAPIQIQIFKDGPFWSGTFVTSITANLLRTDLPYADQNHGFVYAFDANSGMNDGNAHQIYLYGISATGGQNADLNFSPKTITCPLPPAAPTSVNVKDYGAKGDGITDDAPAIQKAIVALSTSGGTVTVPAGTYMLGTSAGGVEYYPNGQPIQNAIIINKPNVIFKGAGKTTILELMAHTKMRVIDVTASNVTVDNLVIDGNKSQRNGSVGWPNGDVVDGLLVGDQVANHITFQNCEVRNGIESGMGFWKSDDATVQNCFSHDNGIPQAGGSGLDFSGGARAIARGNTFTNNTSGLWSAFGSQNVTIQNNTIKNNSQEGIVIGGFTVMNGAGNNSGFTISGNTLSGNGAAGFDTVSIASSNNGTISNNTIVNNANDSIAITDDGVNPPSTNWIIDGNTCSNTDSTGTQQWGIRILGKSTGIILKNNTCQNNGQSVADQIDIAPTASVNSDWQTANTLTFAANNSQITAPTLPSLDLRQSSTAKTNFSGFTATPADFLKGFWKYAFSWNRVKSSRQGYIYVSQLNPSDGLYYIKAKFLNLSSIGNATSDYVFLPNTVYRLSFYSTYTTPNPVILRTTFTTANSP